VPIASAWLDDYREGPISPSCRGEMIERFQARMFNRKASDPKNRPDRILEVLKLQLGQRIADTELDRAEWLKEIASSPLRNRLPALCVLVSLWLISLGKDGFKITSDDLQGCGHIDERMDCNVQSHLIVSRRASPPSPNLMASTLGHAPISEAPCLVTFREAFSCRSIALHIPSE
jgi:hypothetical protein